MNITKKENKIIQKALTEWVTIGKLSTTEKEDLSKTLTVSNFDWKRLSRYCFWTAAIFVLVALLSLFADNWLIEYIVQLFHSSFAIRILLPTFFAVFLYGYGFYRQRSEVQWHYSTEAILFLGVAFTAIAIWQLGVRFDNGSGNIAPLFLIGCIIYGLIGFVARSGLIWLFFLLALGNWFGAETGYSSTWNAYWLGMNYPIRFVAFGAVLLTLCYVGNALLQRRNLYVVSKAIGLTYLFIALWLMSIFGNHDLDTWYKAQQTELLPWVILFFIASIICIYISLKTDDGMLRGFGLTFFAINLYTRFFEYYWNSMNKVIFFLVIAISLALIGRYAERIWHAQLKSERS